MQKIEVSFWLGLFQLNKYLTINNYVSLKIHKDFSNNNNSSIFERFYLRFKVYLNYKSELRSIKIFLMPTSLDLEKIMQFSMTKYDYFNRVVENLICFQGNKVLIELKILNFIKTISIEKQQNLIPNIKITNLRTKMNSIKIKKCPPYEKRLKVICIDELTCQKASMEVFRSSLERRESPDVCGNHFY